MSDIEQAEPAAQQVSSTSVQQEEEGTAEATVDGCDSTTDVNESMASPAESSPPRAQTSESASESESSTPRTSRELKSILALSKEAKLDTNLSTQRRTTLDRVKGTPGKSPKMTSFPVTAESELENFDEKIEKVAKKRKSSVGGGENAPTDGATGEEARRSVQGFGADFVMQKKPNKDIFCWRCHHDSVQVACETCPRAYHLRCLKQVITDLEHWPCPECVAILKAENIQTRSKAMKAMSLEHLCSLLKFAVKRMIQCNGSEPFIQPVDEKQFPEYRSYIIQPMTLTLLEKNIKENVYGSTQAFEADAKWILHNSIIFNSSFPDQSKLTTAAKTIVKICKQEMAEIENCPSCYLNANTKKHTWFVEVCPKPHLLVWAKLKGFPYWPAKVMSINSSGMADVRFFGAHDKAWVTVKDCYLYSVKDPNSGKQKRNDIIECVKELELYVDNLREIYGRVNFAPFKTLLEPDSQLRQLQVFLPNFREDVKEMKTYIKVDKSLNKSASTENSEESDEDKSTDSSEDGEDDEEEEDEGDHEQDEKHKRKDDSTNGEKQKEGMTRIDYAVNTSDKMKLMSKPIKAILIRKRHSSDGLQENAKLARRDPNRNDKFRFSLGNHVTPKDDAEKPKKEERISSSSKVKISDQLIKKLEDLDDDKKELETENKVDEIIETTETVKEIDEQPAEEKNKDKLEESNETNLVEKEKELESELESPPPLEKEDQGQTGEVTVVEDDEKSNEPKEMDVEIDVTKIRNIIHSSLVSANDDDKPQESAKKRKREESKEETEKIEEKEANKELNVFPPSKMVKLVPIENILQKKSDGVEAGKADQLIVLKEIRLVKDGKDTKPKESPVRIKSEVESDDDNNDVQYMEAKRQYLSALNISEKQKTPIKPKAHEIRTRSKTEEKKSKSTDPETPKSAEPAKEIYIKSLSKMQTPKHKARKSFPTPNYSKKTVVARKIVPKSTPTDDELTIVNATTLQPTTNVMILPKLHYNKPRDMSSPPVLAMLPRIQADPQAPKKPAEGSQNYIPQNEGDGRGGPGASNANTNSAGILLNNLLTAGAAASTTAGAVVDLEASTSTVDAELGILKDILPETITKGVGEILCQPPPKLKPRPVGILNNIIEATGVPSTAGPVATRINSIAQKLVDYFRGLLVETIGDLGKSNNPEATISSLKYEIEELNHRHNIELAEIRRNVSIVLKDIQKSVVEERERVINETKANCEMEASKRVEDAKSKQWCANCSKEAQFYCCWNTSYCDYPCQQKHWLKHMSKCTQTASQNQTTTNTQPVRSTSQQLLLTPTTAPKFGALFAKPQKVYLKRANTTFKQTSGSHITLVESTPGNFELLGSGPIAVNGKILASTSVIEKIKSGNIVTVTAPSGATETHLTSANQKVNPRSTASSSESEH